MISGVNPPRAAGDRQVVQPGRVTRVAETRCVLGRIRSKPSQIVRSPVRSGRTATRRLLSESRSAVVSEPWLSADAIAAYLGVTKETVYTWIAERSMPAHKVGRLWKFQTSEVDTWVRSDGAAISDDGDGSGRP